MAYDPRSKFRTGAFFCSLSDAEIRTLKATCRIPLWKNQWNLWKCIRTDKDAPTQEDIRDEVNGFLARVFTDVDDRLRPYDHIEVAFGNEMPWEIGPTVIPIMNRQACGKNLSMSAETRSPIVVWIRFIYRGNFENIPWPYKEFLFEWEFPPTGDRPGTLLTKPLFSVMNCPTDADWLAEEIYTAPVDKPAPAQRELSEVAKETVAKATEGFDPTKTITGMLVWMGVGIVGAVLVARSLK